jgi:hypothetical protein
MLSFLGKGREAWRRRDQRAGVLSKITSHRSSFHGTTSARMMTVLERYFQRPCANAAKARRFDRWTYEDRGTARRGTRDGLLRPAFTRYG